MLREKKMIIKSNDENKLQFMFLFKIENNDTLVISANEVGENIPPSVFYRETFTKEELSVIRGDKVKLELVPKEAKEALNQIISFFLSGTPTFTFKNSQIILSCILVDTIKISLNIPSFTGKILDKKFTSKKSLGVRENSINKKISHIFSEFLAFTFLSNKYNFLIKKLSKIVSKNKKSIQVLRKQNHQLKKECNLYNLVSQQQREINKNLTFVHESAQKEHNEITLNINKIFLQLEKNKNVPLEFQIIKEIKNKHNYSIKTLCFLEDGRLASCGDNGIIIYKLDSYELDFIIQNERTGASICSLKGGGLAFSTGCDIIIRKINEDKYNNAYMLKGHSDEVLKIIEFEDGKLCSSSSDTTVIIWNNRQNYRCIQILKGHLWSVTTIFEVNNYIISAGNYNDKSVRIWNKSTYECIKNFKDIYCFKNNGGVKLENNAIIMGGDSELFIFDIFSFQYKRFQNNQLGGITCVCLFGNNIVLLGNDEGMIILFEPSSNQIILTKKLFNESLTCLVQGKDNKIFSSFDEGNINIFI